MESSKILVFGSSGQLGSALKAASIGTERNIVFLESKDCDVTNKSMVKNMINQHSPDTIINFAAYTNVDQAEIETEKCFLINSNFPKVLTEYCKSDVLIIHLSTDFVFDGCSDIPYKESSQTNPLSIYGKSKLEGENIIREFHENHIIIRTSWLFSEYRNNFLKTMMRKAVDSESLKIVNDQIGCPTYAYDLALAINKLINFNRESTNNNIFHISSSGQCSWLEFAEEIFSQAVTQGILRMPPKVAGVSSDEFSSLAKRPRYSVLDCSKLTELTNFQMRDWKEGLQQALKKIE